MSVLRGLLQTLEFQDEPMESKVAEVRIKLRGAPRPVTFPSRFLRLINYLQWNVVFVSLCCSVC